MELLNIFESSKKKEVINHLKNLVAIGKTDGCLDKVEIEKIKEIGLRNGLSVKKIATILNSDTQATEITGTLDEKFEKLYDIITVIAADGILDEKEMFICENLAVKMGFSNIVSGVMITQLFNGVISGKVKDKIKLEAETFLTY
jgi:hypothetical protein